MTEIAPSNTEFHPDQVSDQEALAIVARTADISESERYFRNYSVAHYDADTGTIAALAWGRQQQAIKELQRIAQECTTKAAGRPRSHHSLTHHALNYDAATYASGIVFFVAYLAAFVTTALMTGDAPAALIIAFPIATAASMIAAAGFTVATFRQRAHLQSLLDAVRDFAATRYPPDQPVDFSWNDRLHVRVAPSFGHTTLTVHDLC